MKYLLLLLLTVSCCARKGSVIIHPHTLDSKARVYKNLIKEHQDGNGFILSSLCDSLLATSLAGISLPKEVIDITAARADDGQWFRRPSQDCYATGDSKSTISRDMLLGLYWYIWRHKMLDEAEALYQYGESHNWIMGEGNFPDGFDRVIMSPAMISTLAQIIYELGGTDRNISRRLPTVWTVPEPGFQQHLTALHLVLRREVYGSISPNARHVLGELYYDSPNNPLFAVGVQDLKRAEAILMNEAWFPSHRLPTTEDRCSGWLPERAPSEWAPCPEQRITHTGGDFLFIYGLLR